MPPASPGIDLIKGESQFCQVFFDDVRACKNDLAGHENHGWTMAQRLLQVRRSAYFQAQRL